YTCVVLYVEVHSLDRQPSRVSRIVCSRHYYYISLLRAGSRSADRTDVRVGTPVQVCVFERTRDRLLGDLDAPDGQRVRGNGEADRADPAVEVVHGLPTGQRRELARDSVEALRHRRVGLKERVRPDPEP